MDPRGDTLQGYYINRETAAAAIYALEIDIPPINLGDIMPEGITRDKVRKTLNLIPISTLNVDLRDYYGHPDEILSTIATAQWITKLNITHCSFPIQFLPVSTTEVIIKATAGARAIKEIIKMESVKRISLNRGTIDSETLSNLLKRETFLEELTLKDTIFTTSIDLRRAMTKVVRIKADNIYLCGETMTDEDFHQFCLIY